MLFCLVIQSLLPLFYSQPIFKSCKKDDVKLPLAQQAVTYQAVTSHSETSKDAKAKTLGVHLKDARQEAEAQKHARQEAEAQKSSIWK